MYAVPNQFSASSGLIVDFTAHKDEKKDDIVVGFSNLQPVSAQDDRTRQTLSAHSKSDLGRAGEQAIFP